MCSIDEHACADMPGITGNNAIVGLPIRSDRSDQSKSHGHVQCVDWLCLEHRRLDDDKQHLRECRSGVPELQQADSDTDLV